MKFLSGFLKSRTPSLGSKYKSREVPLALYSWSFMESCDEASGQGSGAALLDCNFSADYWYSFDLETRVFIAACFAQYLGKEGLPASAVKPRIINSSLTQKFVERCLNSSRVWGLSEIRYGGGERNFTLPSDSEPIDASSIFSRDYDIITPCPSFKGPYADEDSLELTEKLHKAFLNNTTNTKVSLLNLVQRIQPIPSRKLYSSNLSWQQLADSLVLDFSLFDLIVGKRILLWGWESNEEIDLIRCLLFGAGAVRVDFCTLFGNIHQNESDYRQIMKDGDQVNVEDANSKTNSGNNDNLSTTSPNADPSRNSGSFRFVDLSGGKPTMLSWEERMVLLRQGRLRGKTMSSFMEKCESSRGTFTKNTSPYGISNAGIQNIIPLRGLQSWHDDLHTYVKRAMSNKQLDIMIRLR